jgi:hypothetical protein
MLNRNDDSDQQLREEEGKEREEEGARSRSLDATRQ